MGEKYPFYQQCRLKKCKLPRDRSTKGHDTDKEGKKDSTIFAESKDLDWDCFRLTNLIC